MTRHFRRILFLVAGFGILSAFSQQGPIYEPQQSRYRMFARLASEIQELQRIVLAISPDLAEPDDLSALVLKTEELAELSESIRAYQLSDPLHAPWTFAISLALLVFIIKPRISRAQAQGARKDP